MKFRTLLASLAGLCAISVSLSSCAKKTADEGQSCRTDFPQVSSGSLGNAFVFQLDPITKSGNQGLSPTSLKLDDFRSPVALSHLGGHGFLEGQYVDVRTSRACSEGFGAFDEKNQFLYPHSDPHFQEAMSYYFGDTYRARLDAVGAMVPGTPVKLIAHCERDDNAYFSRHTDPQSGQVKEEVCLDDSVRTPGAFYADDATVVVHELQHATTVDAYATDDELNRFWYDEAGSMNEAISDFMALGYLQPLVPATLDPRLFSRWALGTFVPSHVGVRGSHKCPVYDSDYPRTYDPSHPGCSAFGTGAPFSADHSSVSYVYPDGLGWPYANNFDGPGYLKSAYQLYLSQEEIHNASSIITGALWDVYSKLSATYGQEGGYDRASRLIMTALKLLPKPVSLSNQSPVTFRTFGESLVSAATLPSFAHDFTDTDRAEIATALTARGIYQGETIQADWAAVGPGEDQTATPGVKILDQPGKLKAWLYNMNSIPEVISQGVSTGLNGKLDPGEVVALWFDIQNNSDITAGGVQVTASVDAASTASSPVLFLNGNFNIGAISPLSAQIQYYKINGKRVVSQLHSTNPTLDVPTGNSYFKTNPHFANHWTTALWIKVSTNAQHGQVVNFRVSLTPSNGIGQTVMFPVTIN